ncbi:hypothetical protein BH23ACT9_BH23ACT9_34570 [soil metagenome]
MHGIPTGPALWRHVVPQLTGVRMLAVEMVGYSRSIPAGREHSIGVAAQAGHLLALLDDLDIDRAVLVGHDLGGGVAQIAAALARQASSLDVTDTLAGADQLPGLDVPAAVVWGAADRFQRVEYGARLAKDLGTVLRRIEGGKHFTPEDHPDDVARAIRDVLSLV